jgi:hypothetical protein
MPIIKLKVKIENGNFALPPVGEDGITGFSAGEEIKPGMKKATVYVAGPQAILDTITAETGLVRADVSTDCKKINMVEARAKSEGKTVAVMLAEVPGGKVGVLATKEPVTKI